jgi:hypothetical protein
MIDGQSASLSLCQAPIWRSWTDFTVIRQLRVSWCGAASLMRGRVYSLQMLLILESTVILGSESHGTLDHILLSQIWDSPTWRARFLYLYPPGTEWLSYTPRKLQQSLLLHRKTDIFLVEMEVPFRTRTYLRENKNLGHAYRGDWSEKWLCWRRPVAI